VSGPALETIARRAVDGDHDALGDLVSALQPQVFALALRMLWNRADAEDATQDILIRIVTRLAQFDFRSALRTWAYRVAVNYLLDVKKSPVERLRLTFEAFGGDLANGLSADGPNDAEHSVLVEEVKVGCTLAMLQCLDRPHRVAYILGEILELSGDEASDVLDMPAPAFRKRLQRARSDVAAFTRAHCGLVSDTAVCACHRRVRPALDAGRIRQGAPDFAAQPASFADARAAIRLLDASRQALAVHRLSEPRASSIDFTRRVLDAIDTGYR
jgi:RNA polymerase sigma factor (sigma-70 family)